MVPGPGTSELRVAVGIAILMVACAAAPGPMGAQEVRFTPRADQPVERRLAAFLERGGYELWARDTVLAAGDTVHGGLLVLESMVRLSGRVEGDIFVVDGDLFLRPGAEITGDATVLGGGYYGSSLARVEGGVTYRPNLFFQAVPSNGGWVIYPTRETPRVFEPDGLHGIRFPLVNRVDGWTPSVGARLQLVDAPAQPSLHLALSYRTERGEFGGRIEQSWYPTGDLRLGLEAERVTASNDRWLRGDVSNTLSFVLAGRDHRNHYEADRWGVRAVQQLGEGDSLAVRVGAEEARSVVARMGNVLFGSERIRPNPTVDEGTAWSAAVEGGLTEPLGPTDLRARMRLEGADSTAAGDFSYLFAEGHLRWVAPLPPGHTVSLHLSARGDLAGRLPRQRWSAAGGPGTLPTFPVLSLRGPRLAMAAVRYRVPVHPMRVPRLGVPELYAGATTAAAWGPDGTPAFRENVLVGVRFLALELTAAVEPSTGDGQVVLGLRLPAERDEP